MSQKKKKILHCYESRGTSPEGVCNASLSLPDNGKPERGASPAGKHLMVAFLAESLRVGACSACQSTINTRPAPSRTEPAL